jgi:hypothetical protein
VKISPSNQTLILANERPNVAASAAGSLAKTASSAGSVLQRVTIVASQPDSVVYLRADYSSAAAADTHSARTSSGGSSASVADRLVDADIALDTTTSQTASRNTGNGTALVRQGPGTALQTIAPQTYGGARDGYGNALPGSRDTGISTYLPPVEQYARTQRMSAGPALPQYIDVLA